MMRTLMLRILPGVGGIVIGTLAAGAILFALLTLNREPMKKKDRSSSTAVTFEVKTPKKKDPPKQVKPKPRPQPVARVAPTPVPVVGVGLTGIDVGLPGPGSTAMEDLADALLDTKRDMRDLVMTRESVDVMPRPVAQPSPRFPDRLHREGVMTGVVVVTLLIGTDGAVENVQVLSASHDLFERSVMEAVRGWRFEPAQYRGQPVPLSMRQTIHFRQT